MRKRRMRSSAGRAAIDPRHRLAHRLGDFGLRRQRRRGGHGAAARHVLDQFVARHDHRHQIGPAVASHHGLADLRLERQIALDARRRDHVAARGLDEILLAVGDADIAVGIDLADIAGVQPAVDEARAQSPRDRSNSP